MLPQASREEQVTSRRGFLPALVWVAVAVVLLFWVFTAYQARRVARQLTQLEAQAAEQRQRGAALQAERRRYQQFLAVLSASDTRELLLHSRKSELPPLRAYWNDRLGLVLFAPRIPAPAAGRSYQSWIVLRQGNSVSAGDVCPDATGRVVHVVAPGVKFAEAAALAITDEPVRGSAHPTSAPIWFLRM
jgi:anti-sigma-K factor RskA